MDRIIAVGVGGCIGAVARYALTAWTQRRFGDAFLGGAGGTLLVNVLGCLALGALAGVAEARDVAHGARLFIAVGVLGSFTTFSTFAFEVLELYGRAGIAQAATYLAASVGLGLAAVGLGVWIGRVLVGPA